MIRWGTLVGLIYQLLAIAAVAFVTHMIHQGIGVSWSMAYLLAINGVAFVFYGYDKIFAELLNRLKSRVPERVLIWGLAFPGGFLGTWSAMLTLHHKTSPEKQAFRHELQKALVLAVLLAVLFVFAASRGINAIAWLDKVIETLVLSIVDIARVFWEWVLGL